MFEYFKDPTNVINTYRVLVFIFLILMGLCEFKAWEKSEEINKSYQSKANFYREHIKKGVDDQNKKIDEMRPKLNSVIAKLIEQDKGLANEKSKSLRSSAFAKYENKEYIDALMLINRAIDLDATNSKNLLVRACICIELYSMFGWHTDILSEKTLDRLYNIAKNDLVFIVNRPKERDDIYVEAFVRLQYLNSKKASMMSDDIEANKIYGVALEEIKRAQTDFPSNVILKTFSKIIADSQKRHNELHDWIK